MATELSLAVGDLQKHVEKSLVVGAYGAFVPCSALQTYYSRTYRIPDLLKASPSSTVNPQAIHDSYLRVFTILALIQKAAYIRHFLSHDFLGDYHLPFRSCDHWPLECRGFFDLFWEEQWKFCPLDFVKLRLNNRILHDREVLPITKKTILRKGVHSRTWLIEIYPEYDHLTDLTRHGARPHTYVLKSCQARDEESYINEAEAYTLLLHHDDRRSNEKNNDVAQHLVRLYGSWRLKGEFNLLVEYADKGSLESFMQLKDPPKTLDEWVKFWNGLFQLIKPLGRIHELSNGSTRPSIYQGIHQDVTPANILISSNEGISEYDITFKLADFGLTSFEEKSAAGGYIESRDRRGTQMYSAPEIARVTRFLQGSILPASPDIDIWSLACIFSEALVWCLQGVRGLEEYLEARIQETALDQGLVNAGYSGCFHDGNTVLNTVIQRHTDIRSIPCPSDDLVKDLTTLIEDMLGEPGSRPKAVLIHRRCNTMISRARPHARPIVSTSTSNTTFLFPGLFETESEKAKSRKLPPQLPPDYGKGKQNMPAGLGIGGFPATSTTPTSRENLETKDERLEADNPSSRDQSNVQAANDICPRHKSPVTTVGPFRNQRISEHNEMSCSGLNSKNEIIRRKRSRPSGRGENQRENSIENARLKTVKKGQPVSSKPKPYATVNQGLEWISRVKNLEKPQLQGLEYLDRLHRRDQIFLFDNSESMLNHWERVIKVFEVLAYLAKHTYPDKMEISFTNSPQHAHSKHRKDLLNVLKNVKVAGSCNMKNRLDRILATWFAEYEKVTRHSILRSLASKVSSQNPKLGVNIYIFTDGVWQDGPQPLCKVDETVKGIVNKLKNKGMAADYVGIQFIQFGNHPTGTVRLKTLDRDLGKSGVPEDIVDTEPCDGNIWKMLLGSIDPYWDDDETEDTKYSSANGSPSTTRSV